MIVIEPPYHIITVRTASGSTMIITYPDIALRIRFQGELCYDTLQDRLG